MCVDAFQQPKKDQLPPNKTVFELIQMLSQTNEVAKTFENDLSILREKKNLLRTQMISNPESLSEINDVDKEIEHKQSMLKTVKVGLIKQNEDLKKLMNTDGEI